MTNVEVVKRCYDGLKRGDVVDLLAMFDPQVEFRLAEGHPYSAGGASWIGREEITQNFFLKAGKEWEEWDIVIGEMLEAGPAVVVECRYAGRYKPTGRDLDLQACHIWRLRERKVTSFHQYADTARLQMVMGYASPMCLLVTPL